MVRPFKPSSLVMPASKATLVTFAFVAVELCVITLRVCDTALKNAAHVCKHCLSSGLYTWSMGFE